LVNPLANRITVPLLEIEKRWLFRQLAGGRIIKIPILERCANCKIGNSVTVDVTKNRDRKSKMRGGRVPGRDRAVLWPEPLWWTASVSQFHCWGD